MLLRVWRYDIMRCLYAERVIAMPWLKTYAVLIEMAHTPYMLSRLRHLRHAICHAMLSMMPCHIMPFRFSLIHACCHYYARHMKILICYSAIIIFRHCHADMPLSMPLIRCYAIIAAIRYGFHAATTYHVFAIFFDFSFGFDITPPHTPFRCHAAAYAATLCQ